MIKIKTLILWCLFLVCALAVGSCQVFPSIKYVAATETLSPSLIDRSLLTDIPCKAPCWYGLNLDVSNEEDTFTILQQLSFVDTNTIQEVAVGYWDPVKRANIKASLIAAKCKIPTEQQCVGLTIVNDNLKIIGLYPNYSITFGEVVDHLGSPDYITTDLVPPVHSPGCSVNLIWVDQQIIINHTERNKTTFCDDWNSRIGVNRALIVHSITYFLPEYIQLRIGSSKTYPWLGFSGP